MHQNTIWYLMMYQNTIIRKLRSFFKENIRGNGIIMCIEFNLQYLKIIKLIIKFFGKELSQE